MNELVFQIDKEFSSHSNALAIRIVPGRREGLSLQLAPSPAPLSKILIQKYTTEKDREALAFLIEEEAQYQKLVLKKSVNEANLSYNIIHVPYRKSINALKLMAATGKLYFNQRQLACDFFGKTEFYYFVDQTSVSGRLKTGGNRGYEYP